MNDEVWFVRETSVFLWVHSPQKIVWYLTPSIANATPMTATEAALFVESSGARGQFQAVCFRMVTS